MGSRAGRRPAWRSCRSIGWSRRRLAQRLGEHAIKLTVITVAAEYSKTVHFEGAYEEDWLDICEQAIHQVGFQVKSRDGFGKLLPKPP